jgi:predicted amino acid racemase
MTTPRIDNIRRMRQSDIQAQFVLLRTPAPSQVESVVKYTDISLNSEFSVIEKLSRFAIASNTVYKIILRYGLGDRQIPACG